MVFILSFVKHDKHFTATNNERVINFAAALFVRYYEDPFVLGHIQDIVSAMCTNEFCIPALQERFIPTLVRIRCSQIPNFCTLFNVVLFGLSDECSKSRTYH